MMPNLVPVGPNRSVLAGRDHETTTEDCTMKIDVSQILFDDEPTNELVVGVLVGEIQRGKPLPTPVLMERSDKCRIPRRNNRNPAGKILGGSGKILTFESARQT
jgi:hypothetical protein